LKRIRLDVSSLPQKVASGHVIYYYGDGQAHGCGFVPVAVDGGHVLAMLEIPVVPTFVGVSLFSLIDECGTRHDFELGGVDSCEALQWSSGGEWACTNRLGACVDQC